MSIAVSTVVWDHSSHSGSELLLLLAIADHANDSGVAWPSVPTLAKLCRTTPRHCIRLIAAAVASGELRREVNGGPKGANLYAIDLAMLKALPSRRGSVTPSAPVTPVSPLTAASPLTPMSSRPACPEALTHASSTPDAGVLQPLTPMSDEPSLNRQGTTREPVRMPARTTALPDPKPKSKAHYLGTPT